MRTTLTTLGAALTVALGADILLSIRPWGFSFLLFTIIALGAIFIFSATTSRLLNRWALWLILPILVLAIDVFVYANPVVHVLAPAVAILLLFVLVFWLTGSRIPYRRIATVIPAKFIERFFDAIASIPDAFTNLGFGKSTSRVLAGIIIAAPFALLIGSLFAGADFIFQDILGRLFKIQTLSRAVVHTLRTAAIGLYLAGFLAALLKRPHHDDGKEPTTYNVGVALTSFLAVLNILFVAFVTIQIVYLFGGKSYLSTNNITFANYARQGFFELLAVSLIVFATTAIIYRLYQPSRSSRILLIALLAETVVVAASALRRLSFYLDAYGLSASRFYAAAVIVFLAVTFALLIVALATRLAFPTAEKIYAVFIIIAATALLSLNAHVIIARTNMNRAAAGTGPPLDVRYLLSRSADVVPLLVEYRDTTTIVLDRDLLTRELSRYAHPPRDLRTWNLSRARAARILTPK